MTIEEQAVLEAAREWYEARVNYVAKGDLRRTPEDMARLAKSEHLLATAVKAYTPPSSNG